MEKYNGIDLHRLKILIPTKKHIEDINSSYIDYQENNVKEYLLNDYYVQDIHFVDVVVSYEIFDINTRNKIKKYIMVITTPDMYENFKEVM